MSSTFSAGTCSSMMYKEGGTGSLCGMRGRELVNHRHGGAGSTPGHGVLSRGDIGLWPTLGRLSDASHLQSSKF